MVQNRSLDQWLALLEVKHSKKIDLGLSRIQQVYKHCIKDKIATTIFTVAGTNGKGSTVAILSAICQQAGYKVGEFTSPHILSFNERIRINSGDASDKDIIGAFEIIDKNLNGVSLSYFEYATLAAFIIFEQQRLDIAILEVGLGGRLDSVNAVDTDCAIITTIDIDHTSWLGDNRESIGFEKAGIMRKNTPVIYGDDDCPQSIIKHAKNIGAKLITSDAFDQKKYHKPNLRGQYQYKNAATAIAAIKAIKALNIRDAQINAGLQNIKLQGRLQLISNSPQIYVDVAHNKQAAKSLQQWLADNPVKGKTIAVFAVLADKLAIDWLHLFADSIDCWCISSVDSQRAMPRQQLLQLLADNTQLLTSFASVTEAYNAATSMLKTDQDRIIVFGSFYTVSAVMGIQ
jgi:dihydrofolate synthase/folylpolyglutamate synthase